MQDCLALLVNVVDTLVTVQRGAKQNAEVRLAIGRQRLGGTAGNVVRISEWFGHLLSIARASTFAIIEQHRP